MSRPYFLNRLNRLRVISRSKLLEYLTCVNNLVKLLYKYQVSQVILCVNKKYFVPSNVFIDGKVGNFLTKILLWNNKINSICKKNHKINNDVFIDLVMSNWDTEMWLLLSFYLFQSNF